MNRLLSLMRFSAVCAAFGVMICGCATRPALTLAHEVNVPKEFRAGNFSVEHPDYSQGNSAIERYVNAYERGWVLAVQYFTENINFDDPSPLAMSGWPEEAAGGGAGYADACERIRTLIRIYGKEKVSGYLQQFRPFLESWAGAPFLPV